MATRTNPAKVRMIFITPLGDPEIESYIEAANNLLNEVLKDKNLSDGLMENIERWLTAHLIAASRSREAIKQVAGPAEQEFSDIYSKGLGSTSYGQTAMALDPTGTLADLNAPRRPIRLHAIKS